jgi:DNA-binding response OmpR family regulator
MSRILLVEDDNVLRETLTYNLSNEGHEVIACGDGAEALELARGNLPELIVLDVMLPNLDGFTICRILRQESDVPIMILTARDSEVDRIVGLELGCKTF